MVRFSFVSCSEVVTSRPLPPFFHLSSLVSGSASTQRDLATGFQAMCESDPAMKYVFMTMAQALEKSHAASVETTNKFLTHVTEPFADYTGYPAAMRVRPLGCIEMRLARLVVLVRLWLYRTRQPVFFVLCRRRNASGTSCSSTKRWDA